jgi:hypothetical protein
VTHPLFNVVQLLFSYYFLHLIKTVLIILLLQHPKYVFVRQEPVQKSYTYYDFALLRLATHVQLSKTIGVVCLPDSKFNFRDFILVLFLLLDQMHNKFIQNVTHLMV